MEITVYANEIVNKGHQVNVYKFQVKQFNTRIC